MKASFKRGWFQLSFRAIAIPYLLLLAVACKQSHGNVFKQRYSWWLGTQALSSGQTPAWSIWTHTKATRGLLGGAGAGSNYQSSSFANQITLHSPTQLRGVQLCYPTGNALGSGTKLPPREPSPKKLFLPPGEQGSNRESVTEAAAMAAQLPF